MLRYTILDEADEMLNEDWKEELDKIMLGGSKSPACVVLIARPQNTYDERQIEC